MNGDELEREVIMTNVASDFTVQIGKVLTLKKEDIVIFKVPEYMYNNETIETLTAYLQSMGIENEILFISEGMELSILRKEVDL